MPKKLDRHRKCNSCRSRKKLDYHNLNPKYKRGMIGGESATDAVCGKRKEIIIMAAYPESNMITLGEGPECFEVIKSGWVNMYHLIYEDPEQGDYYFEHHYHDEKEMITLFPFTKDSIEKIKNKSQ